MGTTLAFAGMGIIPEWYDANISSAAFLGPCTVPNEKYFSDDYNETYWNFLIDNGIWVLGGPNWDRDLPIIEADGPDGLYEFAEGMGHLNSMSLQTCAAYG